MNTTNSNVKPSTNKVTVVIDRHSHKVLSKLATSYNISRGQFLETGIQYFRKTGINPSDESLSPVEQIKSLEKRVDDVIRIVKAIERDKLSPIIEQNIALNQRLELSLTNLPSEGKIIEVIKGTTNLLVKSIDRLAKYNMDVIDLLMKEDDEE
jgi:hypothetical protein